MGKIFKIIISLVVIIVIAVAIMFFLGVIDLDFLKHNDDKVQLESPRIAYDKNTMQLSWGHVKNATAYDIYINNELKHTVNAANEKEGNDIFVNITEICTNGRYTISIVATSSEYDKFISSDKSNSISILIK